MIERKLHKNKLTQIPFVLGHEQGLGKIWLAG
jgi:hypothetical protein